MTFTFKFTYCAWGLFVDSVTADVRETRSRLLVSGGRRCPSCHLASLTLVVDVAAVVPALVAVAVAAFLVVAVLVVAVPAYTLVAVVPALVAAFLVVAVLVVVFLVAVPAYTLVAVVPALVVALPRRHSSPYCCWSLW